MTRLSWLRRAGHGRAADGSVLTWSVAEGSRGRRWREVRTLEPSGAGEGSPVVSSLLLELDPDGRFAHLELSTAAGLLTLHPEGDGTVHGNAVTAAGVHHVTGLPWAPDDVVLVEGSVVTAVVAGQPGRSPAAGALIVTLDLALVRAAGAPSVGAVARDAEGLPLLGQGATWPLERDMIDTHN